MVNSDAYHTTQGLEEKIISNNKNQVVVMHVICSFVVKIDTDVLEICSIEVTLVRLAAINISQCGVITIQERSRGVGFWVHLFLLMKTCSVYISLRPYFAEICEKKYFNFYYLY